jgi:mono/diheme cytochrome c family protein
VSALAPLHWDGDIKDVRHLVTEVFTGRMGGPAVSDEQAASLGRWLDSIPLVPASPTGSAEAIARGQALFSGVAAGCATCHAGTAFTNNTSVDVGTGAAFQVPSLRGSWLRAPYMHDGCAETLAGRFVESCGGARHGGAGLSAQDVADLQAYLESL